MTTSNKSLSIKQLASSIAQLRTAEQRACTSYAHKLDETLACNAQERITVMLARLLELAGDTADSLVTIEYEELKNNYSSTDWHRLVDEREKWLARAPPRLHSRLTQCSCSR